ncbi:MAG: hypothetical protein ACLVD7_13360 [[Clostridium] leptum]
MAVLLHSGGRSGLGPFRGAFFCLIFMGLAALLKRYSTGNDLKFLIGKYNY